MASHSSASFEKPVPIRPGSEKAGYSWLAPWVPRRSDCFPVLGFLVRSTFFNVEGFFFGSVLVSGAQSVNFVSNFVRVLIGLTYLAFL